MFKIDAACACKTSQSQNQSPKSCFVLFTNFVFAFASKSLVLYLCFGSIAFHFDYRATQVTPARTL